MKSRRRNVSENTISFDNSNGEFVSLRLMGSPLFISEEISNSKIKRFVRIA